MPEPESSNAAEIPAQPATSLAARLSNVFVAPGEVFDEVKSSPPTPANWIAPLVLSCIVGIVAIFVVYSQPNILQRMKETREQTFQQQVATGKRTQAQVDQAEAMAERLSSPTVIKAVATLIIIIWNTARLFLMAAIVWLLGRFAFGERLDFMKTVEATGMVGMISVLATIIYLPLALIYTEPTVSLSPALLFQNLPPESLLRAILTALNLMTLWYLAVLSICLSRLARTNFIRAAAWLYGLWALLTGGMISVSALLGFLK